MQRVRGMAWFWIVLSALVGVAGVRYLLRLRAVRRSGVPAVDDAALEEILRTGRLRTPEPHEPIDMREAAEAEEEFWSQSWDEPEEYPR